MTRPVNSSGMSTLSLCMIVKDEEYHLGECLEMARPFVDEVVVVDTGSTDNTPQIIDRHADVRGEFEWVDDFAAARNASLELASSDWVLVLDADERIDPAGFSAIRAAMRRDEIDGFILKHFNYSDESGLERFQTDPDNPFSKGYPWYSVVPILRLFRRRADIYFVSPIHEIVDPTIAPERIAALNVPIHHYLHGNPAHPRQDRVLRYLAMMEKELEENPSGRLYGIAGASALHFARDYEKAARLLVQAAKYGYEIPTSLEGVAEANYRGGNYKQAWRIYNERYDLGSRNAGMCVNMANLAVRFGDHTRAIALLEEALALGGLGEEKDAIVRNNIAALRAAAEQPNAKSS